MSKIGGMQRVGIDMLANLKSRDGIEVTELLLRTPVGQEKWHLVPFLARSYLEIRRRITAGEVDAVLFSAMPSAVLAAVLIVSGLALGGCGSSALPGLPNLTTGSLSPTPAAAMNSLMWP